jgi:hypothetical protein
MVTLALGPSLFRSQHFNELGQQVACADRNIVMRVGRERVRCNEIYKLTNCAPNSCVVFPYKDAWMRKTQNGGSRGSIRYAMFKNLDDALSAGVGWAWRKDRESR